MRGVRTFQVSTGHQTEDGRPESSWDEAPEGQARALGENCVQVTDWKEGRQEQKISHLYWLVLYQL